VLITRRWGDWNEKAQQDYKIGTGPYIIKSFNNIMKSLSGVLVIIIGSFNPEKNRVSYYATKWNERDSRFEDDVVLFEWSKN